MRIEQFIPANHLLNAVRVSPTLVNQGDVVVTADSLIRGSSLGTAIRRTFTGLQVQTMGTSPLRLNIPSNFIPVQTTIVLSNTTTPFDFAAGDEAFIDCGIQFITGIELQNIADNTPYVSRYQQEARPLNPPYTLSTTLGGDATEGDSTVDVYVFGYYL
jgi:hypothetical protein